MRYKIAIILFLSSLLANIAKAQVEGKQTTVTVDGVLYKAVITAEGDTMILVDMDNVNVAPKHNYSSPDDAKKYDRMKRYAAIVFPYAKEAIRIFRETEYASKHLTKKEKKKRLKELDAQLTKEFEEPLKNLSKLQGKILMKMIEKELDQSMYDLIKGVKGGFSAFYWNAFSKLYDYDLKQGYKEGDYPILDDVLLDYDVSYRIENESALKYFNINEIKNRKKK
jgi:hypothetical protein